MTSPPTSRRRTRNRLLTVAVAGAAVAALQLTGIPGAIAGDDTEVAPEPAGEVSAQSYGVAEFLAECEFSHRLPDDPIVFPGLPGASHMHSFFGSPVTDAHSTAADLIEAGQTTCDPLVDLSSYWMPTLFVDGEPVEPQQATFYYLGEGVNQDVTERIQPYPEGLLMLAGNAVAGPDDPVIARWSCLHAGEVEPSKDFVNCPEHSALESYLDFPQCWDGVNLDSPDHQSHMAYPVAGECPETHPVPVPKMRQVVRYPVNGDPSRFELASGPGYTMHADFINAWPQEELERRVRDCLNAIVKCGADGNPL
ncbi:DUF1996 domain-containing protein [Streptomyces bohaiensis]|uniref:DUF1996 domain-containing protein n=1 Tax=Streptomyces bohaiensis TaxID=1431344 RepID=A0ABX1CHS9_9ACTN|nr:DUF1996 domain-containing protein [Streptomyces bohaiensis]NJQ17455.1 DUF1996 domain-containing protein [Streptomyces bohaiensis]